MERDINWKNSIIDYIPINEQEKRDKDIFLYSMNHFKEILTRNNPIVHITSSAFIVNQNIDHALMVFHNIYKSWSWTGGHVDGEIDFLNVALKEAKEETGITVIEPITTSILSLDVLTVLGHIKNGNYISPHLHLSISYGAIGDDSEPLRMKQDENSDIRWIPIKEVNDYCTEEHMKSVYSKLIERLLKLKGESRKPNSQ